MNHSIPLTVAALALSACSPQPSPAKPAAAAAGPQDDAPAADPPETPPAAAQPVDPASSGSAAPAAPRPRAAAAVTDFALGIVRRTEAFQRGNFVISPASIAVALGMTQAGARGETAGQMVSATGLSDVDHAWLSDAYRALAERLRASGHQLESAQRLYLKVGLELEPAYQRLMQARYGAPVELLDFAANPDASRRQINGWVQQRTRDKIEELLLPRAIRPDTLAVLVDALYLAATWQNAFDPAATRPEPFRTLDGKTVNTPMMQRRGGFALARTPEALVVELPYGGGELVMSLVVPQGATPPAALAASLGSARLSELLGSTATEDKAELHVPRFTLELASHSLIPALKALGIERLFSRADLSGISPVMLDATVSEVVHGARVEVDERGTVAAAATAVVVSKSMPQRIAVDAPFLFLVRDKVTGLVLFAGQVVDPTAG